ncbi:MAG: alpha-amylase [Saprospiraceae bacterium]|nr:alpha-amylase [Saprospiraceae bacterium]
MWENATVYFLMTDRFNNGDKRNDFKHPINPAPFRGFMGGDIKGITSKIEEGYFQKLGVNAIWMTPLVENIYSSVDEGTGTSYGFHGYWTKDWSTIDKRLGNNKDISKMVKSAHKRGIRVIMDVVINHTGPVTPKDTKWPDDWVRTEPNCTYKDYKTTTECTLVKNLPDIRTESLTEVNLPQHLIDKWKTEGRLEKEVAELDEFFKRTNYPRRPYFYIVKWLTDLIREFGIDGFRVDTAKHVEEEVWTILYDESIVAYNDWKKLNPTELPEFKDFYMVGEVYNYNASNGRIFNFGDKKVDYFSHGFDALINFEFKEDANNGYADLFTKYDALLNGPLKGKTLLNYLSSHDDGNPFDKSRKKSYESAIKLLLTQGGAQIYYGDESERSLNIKAEGDASLRSFMNWDEQKNPEKASILAHWQK